MKRIVSRAVYFSCAVIFFFVSLLFAQQPPPTEPPPNNTMTLTTYYPAPFGAYKKLTVSDNFGIGTTEPAGSLHIDAAEPTIVLHENDQGADPAGFFRLLVINDKLYFDPKVTSTNWAGEGNDQVFAIDRVSGDKYFVKGNVGIGTTSPSATLEVSGNAPVVRLDAHTSGVIPLILEADNSIPSNPNGPYIRTGGGGSLQINSMNKNGIQNQYGHMFLNPDVNSNIIMVTSVAGNPTGGNVGIGTTDPTQKLDIVTGEANGQGAIRIIRPINTLGQEFGGVALGGYNDASSPMIYGYVTSFANDITAGAEAGSLLLGSTLGGAVHYRMVVDPNGKVGIGTTSPTAKLDIAGTPGTDGIKFPDGTVQKTALPTCADKEFIRYDGTTQKWQCTTTQPPSGTFNISGEVDGTFDRPFQPYANPTLCQTIWPGTHMANLDEVADCIRAGACNTTDKYWVANQCLATFGAANCPASVGGPYWDSYSSDLDSRRGGCFSQNYNISQQDCHQTARVVCAQ